MKKKYLLLSVLVYFNLKAEDLCTKNLLLSGIPNWIEAFNYCLHLSENYGNQVFGHSKYNQEKLIRDILTKNKYHNSNIVNIKRISDNKQKYVKSAALGILNTIYINPKYYRGLSDNEKEAIIAKAMVQINNNQIQKNIGALITIPVLTHGLFLLAKTSFNLLNNSLMFLKQNINSNQTLLSEKTNKLEIISAMLLNILFTNLYFKNQAKSLDIKTYLKTKNIEALVSYYTKMHNNKDAQENSVLLSLRQPSIEQRLKYLSKLN